MKIDLHVHTSDRSGCGRSSEEEQIRAAIANGLDALVFTDHNVSINEKRLKMLNEKYAPFKIFGAIELSIYNSNDMNDFDHFIVIGPKAKELENKKFTHDYPLLHSYVKSQKGFLMICHPYRYRSFVGADYKTYPPDACEQRSVNIRRDMWSRIEQFTSDNNFIRCSNSDSHHFETVGLYYNEISGNPRNERELAEILLTGKITLGQDDERVSRIIK